MVYANQRIAGGGYATGMDGKRHLTANADGNCVALSEKTAEA